MTLVVYETAVMVALMTIRAETRDALSYGLISPKAAAEVCVAAERLKQKLEMAIAEADRASGLGPAPSVEATGPVGSEGPLTTEQPTRVLRMNFGGRAA